MQKKVILYIRVSTDEQKENGYSLQAQKTHLQNFCRLRNFDVVKIFTEDYSAWKGFDRPEYNELVKYLAGNKGAVNYVLFTQWSRFSRDTAASYAEIKRLQKLLVEPNAAEQWIDFSIPESQYMLAFYLAAPKVENDRLSLRTKAAMREALKQGRWLWKAPFGYKNNKVTKLIDVCETNAELVRSCFANFSTGNYSIEEVRRMAHRDGFKLTKQAFINFLKNPFYIGKLNLPATSDELATIIPGIHAPIVEEEIFIKVQSILRGKKKPYKGQTKHDQIPLIGQIICPSCNRMLTGSAPHGNGGRYYYYHCQRAYGCKFSRRADRLNKELIEYLQEFEVKREVVNLYEAILEKTFMSNSKNIESEKVQIEKQIQSINERINTIEEKYFDQVIRDDEFRKYKDRYEMQKNELVMKHATLTKMPTEYSKYMRFGFTLVSNISKYYQGASLETKKLIIGSIFPEKLRYENESYRTTKINDVFDLIYASVKDFNKKQAGKNSSLSTVAPPSGLEPETP